MVQSEQQLSNDIVDVWAAALEYVHTGRMPENVDSRTKDNIISLSKLLRRRDLAMKLLVTKSTLLDTQERQAKQYAQFCDAYESAMKNESRARNKTKQALQGRRTYFKHMKDLMANISSERAGLYLELERNLKSIWQDFEQWYKEDYKRARVLRQPYPYDLPLATVTGEWLAQEENIAEKRHLHRKSKPLAIKNEEAYEKLIGLVQDAVGKETASVYKSYLDAMKAGVKQLSKQFNLKSNVWLDLNVKSIASLMRSASIKREQTDIAYEAVKRTEKDISQLSRTIAIMKPMYVIAVLGDVLEELGQNLMYSV